MKTVLHKKSSRPSPVRGWKPFFMKSGDMDSPSKNLHLVSDRPFFNHSGFDSSPGSIHKKLTIGQPGDKYEREADAVADRVMCMSDPLLQRQTIETEEEEMPMLKAQSPLMQRKCAECEKEDESLHRKPLAGSITPYFQRQEANGGEVNNRTVTSLKAGKSGGRPLLGDTRSWMENWFGTDFSRVRIHTDSNAVQMSRDLNAQAFTYGSDIYFNRGRFNPGSAEGKHLLAHELTHVVQQRPGVRRKESTFGDPGIRSNPIVGLKRGDGLVFGTWHLRPRVQLLQEKLNEKMAGNLKIDGMFGSNTADMLRAFRLTMMSGVTDSMFLSLQEGATAQPALGLEPFFGGPDFVDKSTGDALMGASPDKEIPLFKSDIMFVLTPPPPICQGDSNVCWAAAASSWLNVTAILPGVTKEDLIIRFGHCICEDGSMPEIFVPPVYQELGIELSNVTTFDYEFLKSNLQKHGHVILIINFAGSVEHAVVAYAVGVSDEGRPDQDFYSIFDPIDCKYHNIRFGSHNILSIGRRSQPKGRALCPNVVSVCGED